MVNSKWYYWKVEAFSNSSKQLSHKAEDHVKLHSRVT